MLIKQDNWSRDAVRKCYVHQAGSISGNKWEKDPGGGKLSFERCRYGLWF